MNFASVLATAVTALVVALESISSGPRPSAVPAPFDARVAARIEREVLEPLRERHLGRMAYSRAMPQWDPASLAVVEDRSLVDSAHDVGFRVERSFSRGPIASGGAAPSALRTTVWLGRIDASGRIELAPLSRTSPDGRRDAPVWRLAADVVADHASR